MAGLNLVVILAMKGVVDSADRRAEGWRKVAVQWEDIAKGFESIAHECADRRINP